MKDPSEFGKILRVLMAKNNLSQEKLAKKIDVMPSTLVNYISGETVPTMDFLLECIKKFNMEKEESVDLIRSYFSVSAKKKKKITFNTQFMDPQRIEVLAKVLTVLMLFPDIDIHTERDYKSFRDLASNINNFYSALGKAAEFHWFED
jgi:transcriptional regulator with XRE-family HTH domain